MGKEDRVTDMKSTAAAVDGVDVDRVTAWFTREIPGAQPPLAFDLIAGGRSNLTFRVTDASGSRWVLRRPPLGHVLATAHDMEREHRIISALVPTAVPVPSTLGLCTDPEVNGSPFYVMTYVDGHVLRDLAQAEATFTPTQRRHVGESLIDTLAAIHAVDPDAVGLGDLGRKDGYVERQLKRWYGQFQKGEIGDVPGVDRVHDRLAASIPAQAGVAIVHGDYRLDNTMLADDGAVAAALDWEICTLGDPLADVGLLMVYWADPGDELAPLGVAPTTADGFPRRGELLDRYANASGHDLSEIGFYVAFGYWKLACILTGVATRYAAGAMGDGGADIARGFADMVSRLADAAESALDDR